MDWQDICTEIYGRDPAHFLMVANAAKVSYRISIANFIDGLAGGSEFPYILLKDIKSANTPGGTFSSGAWRTRDINTKEEDTDAICSLSYNQFSLPAGDYRILGSAPAYMVSRHKTKLVDIDTPADLVIGSSEYAHDATLVYNRSVIAGVFSLSTETSLEIQHQCEVTRADKGFGVESNFGVVEVYTIINLWKVG